MRLTAAVVLGVLACAGPAFAQNGTTIGTLTALPTFDNIGVKLTYTGDANTNNTATLQYRVQGSSTWLDAHTATVSMTSNWPDRRATTTNGVSNAANQNQFRAAILGLTAGAIYELQVTVSDADGVSGTNPATATVTMLDPATLAPQSGTTKYLDTTAAGGGDGSSGTPYNTWANAQTGTACGDTLIIKATSGASAGVTLSKSCSNSNWYQVQCADRTVVTFSEGAGTTPNLTISGDAVRVRDCRFGASSDTVLDLTSTPTDIWIDHDYFVDALTAAPAGGCVTGNADPTDDHFYNEASIRISSANAKNITLTNNDILAPSLATAGGCVADHSDSAGRGIWVDAAMSNNDARLIIKGNTMTGGWADCLAGYESSTDAAWDNTDILNNTITGCFDDLIQPEGRAVNLRVGGNILTASSTTLAPIAMQAAYFGPVYVYRNVISYAGPADSFKVGGTQNIYWFHNTAKNTQTGGVYCWGTSGEGTPQYVTTRNNICQTNQSAAFQSINSTGTSLNYDLLYRASGTPIVELYDGVAKNSVALWCAASPSQECQGVQSNPSLDGSLHITNASPAYNVGVAIANINDATSAWPACNGAPDMGAYEVNAPCGPAGPAAIPRFRFLRRHGL